MMAKEGKLYALHLSSFKVSKKALKESSLFKIFLLLMLESCLNYKRYKSLNLIYVKWTRSFFGICQIKPAFNKTNDTTKWHY